MGRMAREIIDLPPTDWRTVPPKPDHWQALESFIVWIVTAAVLGLAAIGLRSLLYDPGAEKVCGKTTTGVEWCLRDR